MVACLAITCLSSVVSGLRIGCNEKNLNEYHAHVNFLYKAKHHILVDSSRDHELITIIIVYSEAWTLFRT